MIYEYKNKYYVNISPRIYKEVKVSIENDKVNIKPLENKIELGLNDNVTKVSLQEVKTKLIDNEKKIIQEKIVKENKKFNNYD